MDKLEETFMLYPQDCWYEFGLCGLGSWFSRSVWTYLLFMLYQRVCMNEELTGNDKLQVFGRCVQGFKLGGVLGTFMPMSFKTYFVIHIFCFYQVPCSR